MNINNLDEKFSKAQDALIVQQSDLSLESISNMVDDESIDISPKYQRRERWDIVRQSELIESFILNIPVPPVYFSEDDYGTYSVIDGKQRITAINKFLRDELKLKGLENFEELNGKVFSELPKNIKNALKVRPYLRVVTLLRQSDKDVKYEVFLRLNKAGVALNSQEIRNVAFRGDFNNAIFELAEQDEFVKQLNLKKSSKKFSEMLDVQYVLRFFTLLECWDSFPGNMDKAMDSYMKNNFKLKENSIIQKKELFNAVFETCRSIWGDECFQKPGGSKKAIQGYFDIQMVPLGLLDEEELRKVKNNKVRIKNSIQKALEVDDSLDSAVSQFTSNPKNVKYRIETVYDIIKAIIE